jgi:hypothetical protein
VPVEVSVRFEPDDDALEMLSRWRSGKRLLDLGSPTSMVGISGWLGWPSSRSAI